MNTLTHDVITIDEAKEKHDGLRIYHHEGDDYAQGVINLAEALPRNLCVICGKAL
ncbi:hypothetical protein [Pseudomonas sp. NPDC099000]|uniref:hypothetical protein n=1 Tax=Pseudomonas sp. NPDC099000 TaxID=3364488 RepID=UPI003839D17B